MKTVGLVTSLISAIVMVFVGVLLDPTVITTLHSIAGILFGIALMMGSDK